MKTKRIHRSHVAVCLAMLSGWLAWAVLPDAVAQTATNIYGTAGTYPFTVPAGVSQITVETWAGGGAGGGVTGYGDEGAGGAGGQYARKIVAVIPGSSHSIVVGAGGVASTGNGGAGGDSTFDVTVVVAKGGAGGGANNGAAGQGSTSGGVGDVVYRGGNGGEDTSTTSGAGGGGAGSTGNGGHASGTTAGSGRALYGGNGGAGRTTAGAGIAGNVYGGGGSGARTTGSTDYAGGAGARGLVVITYSPQNDPAAIVFSSSPQTVVEEKISELITIQLRGTNGLVATATNDVSVNLSSSLPGTFRSAANTADITSVMISSGQSQASFRYTSATLGTHVLTAAAAGLTAGTQNLEVVLQRIVIQTYYLPFDEDGAQAFFDTIRAGDTENRNVSVVSISCFASNTVIYYDHWEDGYEADLSSPTQSTTEVWGDLNTLNGCSPKGTNPVTCASAADDRIARGQVVFSVQQIPIPRGQANIFRDGRDKIGVTRPVAVTRSGWDTGPATLLAGSVEVADTGQWGTKYIMPAGENVAMAGDVFDITGISIMAMTNDTVVRVDLNRDGTFERTSTLDEGQTLNITNGVQAGSVVTSTAPVQVHMSAGIRNSNYCYNWYTIAPVEQWGSDYYNPVGTTRANARADVVLYNPNSAPITVVVEYSDGEEIFSENKVIAANSYAIQTNTLLNYAQRYSNELPFYGLGIVDADADSPTTWDWGFSLVPEPELSTIFLVGWAPGRDPYSTSSPTTNVSPVWVTATRPTTIYVDYNGDGGPLTNDCGTYNFATNVGFLQSVKIYDPDRDQTGMRIFTCDGTLLAGAWGEDPLIAPGGEPSLDIGTTCLPLPSIGAKKTVAMTPVGDTNGDGQLNPGETIRYTIIVTNPTLSVSGSVTVEDDLPIEVTYVPDSTRLDGAIVIPDDGTTPFPLDEGGFVLGTLEPQTSRAISFEASVDEPYLYPNNTFTNMAVVYDDVSTIVLVAEVTTVVYVPGLNIEKNSDADCVANGQIITYTINVANTSAVQQTGVTLADVVPANTTYVPDSVFITAPVETGNLQTNTVRDDFSSASYSLNTGTASWLGNWVEQTDGTTSPTAGSIQIASGRLRITNPNSAQPAIYRDVNLADVNSAVLTYRYEASNNLEVIDSVALDVSTDNGANYTVLTNFTGFSGSRSATNTHDIKAFAGANTRVRFRVVSGYKAADELFRVDWIQIQYTTGTSVRVTNTFAGTPPPTLHSWQTLLPGEGLTATFQVQAAADLTGVAAITNRACVTSDAEPTPQCDSVMDMVCLASIGDYVWEDVNGNGIQEPGEQGMEGVTVTLYDAVSSNMVATTSTSDSGAYLFTGIPAGTYFVGFANLPLGYQFTVANQGADDAVDSDANSATGLTVSFALVPGANDLTRDAGICCPASLVCPPDITVECDQIPAPVEPAVEGCCEVVSLTHNDVTNAGSCAQAYVIVRTWSLVDSCGYVATCVQNITVRDTTPPVLPPLPAGGDLGCNPTPPACVPGLKATDNCDPDIDVVCTPGPITGDCSKSQTFTYSAVDDCGNAATPVEVTYTWKVDTTAPVLPELPAGGDLGCNPATLPSCVDDLLASDNCDGEVAVVCSAGAVTGDDCNKTQVFTYKATDACGNEASDTVTYTWKVDTTAPVLPELPAGGDLGCNPATLPSCVDDLLASDNCDGEVAVVCSAGAVTGDDCNKTQVFTYKATDACGNEASDTVTYTWKVDTTAPVLPELPAGTWAATRRRCRVVWMTCWPATTATARWRWSAARAR